MKKNFILTIMLVSASFLVNSQNVGIGTTNPSEKLQVAGNIKADTVKPNAIKLLPNAGAGKVLTSDAGGNASWQNINASGSESLGYGSWGDCSMSGLTEYLPVADSSSSLSDLYGYSVSVSGDFTFIGVPLDDIGANPNQGSVWVYHYTNGNWVFLQKITDNTGAEMDMFGNSVFVSGNFAIIAAKGDDIGANIDQGSASIYQYNGTNWVFMQKITDATGATEDYFGNSVSLSGNFAAVGASEDDNGVNVNQGSVSVFQYNGSNWVLMQKIVEIGGSAEDTFGESVSISGNFLVVGIPMDDVTINQDQGTVIFYRYNGSNWLFQQKYTDGTGAGSDYLGLSVSVSGNYAVVGNYGDEIGANGNQGSVLVYFFNGSNWVFVQKIWDFEGKESDNFGIRVSLSGNLLLVGAPGADVNGVEGAGSVSIYSRVGSGWGKIQTVTDKMGLEYQYLGTSVSIDGNNRRFILGAYGYLEDRGKAIFGKVN